MEKNIVFFICIIYSLGTLAQGMSNKGKEFWLGYGHNVLFTADNPSNSQHLVLYLSAEKATQVTVTINGTSWSQTVQIPAGKIDNSIIIPKSGADDCRIRQEGKFERGIHIMASEPIVAYAHQYGVFSSAATMLFPVETFGYNYFSVNYTQQSNYPNSYSWMFVVASEDNTRLSITPSDTTMGGILPGQTIFVDLKKGELFNLFGKKDGNYTGKDLTGTRVTSVEGPDGNCHPIGVFSGSSRMVLCNGDGGEVMQQQIFPASVWGNTYLTHHDVKNVSNNVNLPMTNFFRVLVADPSTVVKRNGTVLSDLVKNRYYQFSSNSGDFIEADKPILVCQFTPSSNQCTGTSDPPVGDPEMYILAPLQQGIKSTTFYNTRNQNIDINYVDIIVHKNGLPTLKIDNAPPPQVGIKQHPANSDYVFVAKRLLGPGSQHTITCDSGFVTKVCGYGNYESYGYLAGMLVNNLNGLIKIDNMFNTTGNTGSFTCPNTPFYLSVRLAYKATSLLWQFSKTSGLSISNDTLLINPVPTDSVLINGRKYFNYALPGPYHATAPGWIQVPLNATSPEIDHCGQTENIDLYLEVREGPRAGFEINYSGCMSDSARFISSPIANGFRVDRQLWYFDDGTIDSSASITKKIPGGSHPVQHRVIADMGCLHDSVHLVTTSQFPVAFFAVSDSVLCPGDSIRLTDASSYNGGQVTQWHWNMGDGNSLVKDNGQPFYHRYAQTGVYEINLWVNTNSHCRSDKTTARRLEIYTKPPIDAGPDITRQAGQAATLQASVPVGGNFTYQWIPADGLSDPSVLRPAASPHATTTYYLLSTDRGNCASLDSMRFNIINGFNITNAFSPNGDGWNDTWNIPVLNGFPNCRLNLYDRYGQLIFSTKGYTRAWDGTKNGRPLPAGVYYYLLNLGDGTRELHGSVTVLR